MKRIVSKLSSLDDIWALQGCQTPGYCQLILKNKKIIVGGCVSNSSKFLDSRFLKISKSIHININHIVSFSEKYIRLSNDIDYQISRRNIKNVHQYLTEGLIAKL